MNDEIPVSSVIIHWGVAMPIVIVALAALAAMLADAFTKDIAAVEWVTVIGLSGALFFCVAGAFPEVYSFAPVSNPNAPQLVADRFALFLNVIFCMTGLITVLMSRAYLDRMRLAHGEYHILMLFAIAGMMLMVQATELITIFVALETFSIALYVLSAFARSRRRSSEAGLKYLLLGAFSSAFFLFGIAFIYGATGTTNLYLIQGAVEAATSAGTTGTPGAFSPITLSAGIALLLVGLGFKVAAVPFHVWTPDVYEGAPTPVTAFMSVATKAAAFGAMGRILLTGFPTLEPLWGPLVGGLAVATMVLGNVVALTQTNIKRLLAYSSIAHAGYLMVGLVGVDSLGRVGDTVGILYYLLAYAAMNLGAFAVVTYLGRKGQEFTEISHLSGLARRNPGVAVAMSIFMFSLAGVPPFVGFYGKWVLFVNAVERGQTALVVIGVLASVVSAYYYLRVVVRMWMEEPEPHVRPMGLAPGNGLVIGLCAITVLLAGLAVSPFVTAAERAVMTDTPSIALPEPEHVQPGVIDMLPE